MGAINTIRSKKDFDLIYKRGRSVYGSFFSLRFLKTEDESRFATVISAKTAKSAVLRNKKKRQLREIIRLNQDKMKKGFWILITLNDKSLKVDYQELEKEFIFLCKKAGILG